MSPWDYCDYCYAETYGTGYMIATGYDEKYKAPVTKFWCGRCPEPTDMDPEMQVLLSDAMENWRKDRE